MTTSRLSLVTFAALLAASLGGTAALAQPDQTPAPQAPAPQHMPMTGQGMMKGKDKTAQMNKMMENCNNMMERAMQAPPSGSNAPQKG